MKFVKGVVIGGLIVTGMTMMYTEMGKNDKKKVITIHMPKPKILSSEIKEDSCKVYVEDKSCFTPLTVEKMGKARIRMKEVAEKNAIANGLYENAKKLLKNFVGELYNLEEYQIKFEEDNK